MGHFHVDCEVTHIRNPKKSAKVSHLLVDTGSEYTWISEETLKQLGIKVQKKDVPLMANGQTITRAIGYAILRAEGFETVDEVVFGEPGDLQLLGSRTLEGFGAMVDARRKRLVAAGPIPAAGTGCPMPEAITYAEIKKRYEGEWVLLADAVTSKDVRILRGKVL